MCKECCVRQKKSGLNSIKNIDIRRLLMCIVCLLRESHKSHEDPVCVCVCVRLREI